MYVAWLDESGSNQAVDPGTYILSAVICEREQASQMRATMRALLAGRRHRKLHWRDESPARQELIVKTIAALDVEHLVVIRSDELTTDRPERQRRLCMERMLPELAGLGVEHATLESRGKKDDLRDIQTLDYLRRKRQLERRLHIDHIGGPADPMLWIPDACCGAVTQMRCGNDRFYMHIEPRATLIGF